MCVCSGWDVAGWALFMKNGRFLYVACTLSAEGTVFRYRLVLQGYKEDRRSLPLFLYLCIRQASAQPSKQARRRSPCTVFACQMFVGHMMQAIRAHPLFLILHNE